MSYAMPDNVRKEIEQALDIEASQWVEQAYQKLPKQPPGGKMPVPHVGPSPVVKRKPKNKK